MKRELRQVDILRHELKALRFLLDNFHSGALTPEQIPAKEDFQSAQGQAIYDVIRRHPERAAALAEIGELELDGVDLESFLRLSGEHYYSYPELVRERAAAIRSGRLKVEAS